MSTKPATEQREQLERERDFLLKSLDDLEAEREAGNIDAESYTELHDDYTARAAATIRALRDGLDARPKPVPISWQRRGVVVGAIVAFAVVSAVALAAALGARLPGQTSSGNSQVSGSERRTTLEAAVKKKPNDVQAHLALARFLATSGDLPAALKQFDAAVKIEPDNPEALAQGSRARALVAEQVPRRDVALELVAQARANLDRAVQVAPNYADAHFFRGVLLFGWYNERDVAISEFQRYLVLDPNGTFAKEARGALAQLTQAPPTTNP